ncbi:MAG: hypothetical protein ACI9VR_003654 [Cognaticolwellia sp.]
MDNAHIAYIPPYGGEALFRTKRPSAYYARVRRFLDECTDAGAWPDSLSLSVMESLRPATKEDQGWSSLEDLQDQVDDSLSPQAAVEEGHHLRSALVRDALLSLGAPNHGGGVRYRDKRTRAEWPWSWETPDAEGASAAAFDFLFRHEQLPKLKFQAYGDEAPFWPQVELTAFYDFRLTTPGAKTLLPGQDSSIRPCRLQLDLSGRTMILGLKFPFSEVDRGFVQVYDGMAEAFGKSLPAARLRTCRPNKKGDAMVRRKLGFCRSDW